MYILNRFSVIKNYDAESIQNIHHYSRLRTITHELDLLKKIVIIQ